MTILGLDPGFALIGWSIIQKNTIISLVDYGCIETEKGKAFELRLEQIYKELSGVLREFKPDALVMEELFFNTNQTTGINVAQARGVLILAAVHHDVPIFEYTPLQVKVAVTGYGRADKQQMQRMVQQLFKLPEIPKPDDAADALAVAYCHAVTGTENVKLRTKN